MTTELALPPEVQQSLVIETLVPYEHLESCAPGTMLFREGTPPAGVYVLHDGEVDLTFSVPRSGEPCPLLVAEAGQILAVTCVVSGRPHDCSAVTRTPCVTGFIEKNRFLALLDEKPDLWLSVLRMISTNINACWDCMRVLSSR